MTDTHDKSPSSGGFFGRLRERFSRGARNLGESLGSLFGSREIDADLLDELETRLIGADVGIEATQQILKELRAKVARRELTDGAALHAALRETLIGILKPCEQALTIDPQRQPFVIMVVGVNGSGKTTSIGKLAQRLTHSGHKVMLAAGDTFRAAASEQLDVWAQRSGATILQQPPGADPASVVFDALRAAKSRGVEVVIADTAGRLHSQSHLMEELKKIRRVVQRFDADAPHEVLLVLDANQGQNALAQAIEFHAAVGVTGLVITKLDGTARGGIVVAIARRLALPIRFIGIGEQAADFGQFDAAAFTDALLGAPASVKSAP
ncbi:MAG: signal recognition particle-docking protein FtsY [Nevskiaceae bacterium]|jgi:fused signal recognition particle receptor|nr:signal recognition particle-docking protein FtsY [Nevskiaceae bacterium]